MNGLGLDGTNDVGENVADDGAQQKQDCDNDDGDEHQNQRVLYQTLALFTWKKQHVFSPPFECKFLTELVYCFRSASSNHYTRKRSIFQGFFVNNL